MKQTEVEVHIPSSLENLSVVRAMIRVYLQNHHIVEGDIVQLLSVVDELATNAIEHAYQNQLGEVIINIEKEGSKIRLFVEDNGLGYNDKKASKEEGGMGLILARKLVDILEIVRKEQGTVFRIEKEVREVI